MRKITRIVSYLLTILVTMIVTGWSVSNWLPSFLSIPVKYISVGFTEDVIRVKDAFLKKSMYEVSNDIDYNELPHDIFSIDYYLDWSYNENDTFFVERFSLASNEVVERSYFTPEFVRSKLHPYSFRQDGNEIISKSSVTVRPKHFLFTEEGIVFNFKYGPLICAYNSDSVIWENHDFTFHHSIEKDHEGNLWACGLERIFEPTPKDYPYDALPFYIVKVDGRTGRTLMSISLIDILEANDLNYMLNWKALQKGLFDYHHLNDIQPVLADNKFAQKGDLILSLRDLNTILVYRPSTNRVLFHKNNISYAQHDVDIVNDSCISIFSNNSYIKSSTERKNNSLEIYNFTSGETYTYQIEFTDRYKINTWHQGLCEIVDDQTFMIDETEAGVVYVVHNDQVNTFYKLQSENTASLTNWSRLTKID